MFSLITLVVCAGISAALAQKLTINTPSNVVQCQPIQFTWTGGKGPFYLELIPAGQVSAPAIKQFPTQNGTSFTWLADLPSGTSVTVSLRDSDGVQAFSDTVSIHSSPDSKCVNDSVSGSGSAGSAAPTPEGMTNGTAPAATATGSSSQSPVSSGPSGAAKSTGTGSAATSSPKASSAASSAKHNHLAVAGMMGVVGAILF